MATTSASIDSALAISTICIDATLSDSTGASGAMPLAEPGEQVGGVVEHPPAVEEPAALGLVTDEDVLGDGERRQQRELLVDDRHAEALGSLRVEAVQIDRLAPQPHLAARRRHGTGEDLEQRRLPGAVLSDDRLDATALDRQGDVVERGRRAEAFGDAAELEGERRRVQNPAST